jgi:radical SAM superfamily enzyme YgiQ (UPF0313 family)
MKVLLVYTNRNRFMAPPPIGLATLCPPLEAQGHEVRLLDLMFERDAGAALDAALDDFGPHVVGYSIRNVDEQDMSRPSTTLADIRPLVRAATVRGLPVILGGAAFSTFPEQLLDYMGADYGIAGQGEEALPRLLASIEGGGLDEGTPGLVWRDEGRTRANPPDLRGYDGVRTDWRRIDYRGYRRSMLQAAVVVRSGCRFRCSYCDVPHVFGDDFVARDVESVVDDVRRLRLEHGVRVVFLNDPCFNAPVESAKNLLEALARARLGVYISSTFVPVTGEYDDELFDLYRRAGGNFAVFGIEALSETMARSYAKPFVLDDVFRSCEMARRHGVRSICFALFGGPGETDATFDEAIQTIGRLPYSFLTTCFGVRILPRAPLFDIARRDGIVSSASELFSPRYYLSPELDLARARARLKGALFANFPRVMRMLPIGLRLALARNLGVVF